MIAWLWDAKGPVRSSRGITDNWARALAAAEVLVRSGHAVTATVEAATVRMGADVLDPGYERTGEGWRGERSGAGIAWLPLVPS